MPATSASPHRIKRQSIPEALFECLRERILDGEFKEGDALIQDAMAAEYDTSRMLVREALRQLEAAGLLVMPLHKGAAVTGQPTKQTSELFELRVRRIAPGHPEAYGRALGRIARDPEGTRNRL